MEKAIAPAQWQEWRASARQYLFFTARLQFGALAQLGERLICIQEVRSSILLGSTMFEPVGLGNLGSVAQVVRAHA